MYKVQEENRMYLSDIKIEGYRLFKDKQILHLRKGLNVLVGENGCGKSTVIDAIRLLLNEDEYARNGISAEDFYSSVDKKEWADNIFIKGRFSDLSEDKKIEYITWLDKQYNAILNIDIVKKQDRRNNYKKVMWGGEASNSVFEWEPLNDIQCVYLPALRDAEKKLKASRGSRLARLLINLSKKTLEEKRKAGELMDIEKDVNDFNETVAKRPDIARANELINDSLENALGTVFTQTTKIQFGDVTFERIVEALRIVFFPGKIPTEESVYRNLFENSLGYNNLIYLATILAEFEGLKENYSSPRILLIEELEAHLHPQIQIKVLKYLKEQAEKNDIQIIITTHSTTIVSATPQRAGTEERKGTGIIMKMVGITPCYRITLENGSYGVETYINADSKIQITFEDGNTLIGYIECVEYGTYSDENDTLVIRGENGELYILLENRIKDIEELHE